MSRPASTRLPGSLRWSAIGELFDRGGVGTEVAVFGDSGRFFLGERPDGDLDHVDSHGAIVGFGELVVAVQDSPVAELASGGPPGGRVVDSDVAVER